MKRRLTCLVFASLLLAGCSVPWSSPTATEAVTLSVRPQLVGESGLTVLSAYSSSDVNHVTVRLYTLVGAAETVVTRNAQVVEADVLASVLGRPLSFSNLHYDTTYRIRAFAYRATGVATADLISATDSGSYVDVAVGSNAHPAIAALPVQLLGSPFNSLATSSFAFSGGGYEQGNATMSRGI